ncbi:MAG TPA: outer membrane protein assembly factor BamE [Albitalea sp.]|jgi:hypothetical protein|nr:outer membrane protein assembly factor BamE [Albitalea sp.]
MLIALVAGCDSRKIGELEEGVSTEADVRKRFGEPAATYAAADGSHTLEYPRQPEGQRNYMITIGPDGRMSALRQVLKAENFAEVTAGLDKAQVRRLLGRPAATQAYPLKAEEVWDWRFLDAGASKLFSVTFDREGRVITTAMTADPRDNPGG